MKRIVGCFESVPTVSTPSMMSRSCAGPFSLHQYSTFLLRRLLRQAFATDRAIGALIDAIHGLVVATRVEHLIGTDRSHS